MSRNCIRDGMLAAILATGTAAAQTPKPPTISAIREACLSEHTKFCPFEKGGTRFDIACLQQHHINLSLSCRNTLRQVAAMGASPAGIKAP